MTIYLSKDEKEALTIIEWLKGLIIASIKPR
jgi:hypothetical protein